MTKAYKVINEPQGVISTAEAIKALQRGEVVARQRSSGCHVILHKLEGTRLLGYNTGRCPSLSYIEPVWESCRGEDPGYYLATYHTWYKVEPYVELVTTQEALTAVMVDGKKIRYKDDPADQMLYLKLDSAGNSIRYTNTKLVPNDYNPLFTKRHSDELLWEIYDD